MTSSCRRGDRSPEKAGTYCNNVIRTQWVTIRFDVIIEQIRINPPTTHAAMISQGDGRAPAINDGVRKMPDPIVPPMAIMVMSNKVRLRRSSDMVARAYIKARGG